MADGINYTGILPRYVLDRLFDNLTDISYRNVDDRNSVGLLVCFEYSLARPSGNFN